jgi:hypothetical protein
MLIVGTVLLLLRLPANARNLIWAEDGSIFLTDAFTHDYLTNLFTPYAGYMHFVPRTAAEISSILAPAEDLGWSMNILGAMVWSTVALAAFSFTQGRIGAPLRALLWLLVILLPIGSQEVATNTANSHWFLMFGLFVVVSSRSGTWPRAILGSALVAAAMLSDPLSLMFLPLVVGRLVLGRSMREQLVTVVYGVAAVVQLLMVIGTTRDRGGPGFDPLNLSRYYLLRVVWGNLVGAKTGEDLFVAMGDVVVLSAAGTLIAVLAILIVLRSRSAGLSAISLAASIVSFSAISILTWTAIGIELDGHEIDWGGRYLVLPSLLLTLSVVSALSIWISRRPGAKRQTGYVVGLVVASALLLGPGIDNFQTPDYKGGNPQTSTGLAQARSTCATTPLSTTKIQLAPERFFLMIPCEVVLERNW